MSSDSELSREQILALNDMVSTRMENTGEDRTTACFNVKKYLVQHLNQLHPETPN